MRSIHPDWKCVFCGCKLPTKSRVWRWRYEKFLWAISKKPDSSSGYYCDPCADKRESGNLIGG